MGQSGGGGGGVGGGVGSGGGDGGVKGGIGGDIGDGLGPTARAPYNPQTQFFVSLSILRTIPTAFVRNNSGKRAGELEKA